MHFRSWGWNGPLAGFCVAVLLAGATVGCGKKLIGKPTYTLKLTATSALNNGGRPVAYPLRYRVIQVTDPLPLAGMKLERLWDKEESMLGGALLSKGPESMIEPNAQKAEKPVPLDPQAKAIVVIGNFTKTKDSCFYHVQPITGKKSVVLDLTADATCLRPTKP